MNAAAIRQMVKEATPPATLLDRFVNYLSPQAGVRRLHARTLLSLSGGYEGARGNRRALEDMPRRGKSADGDTIGDLQTLRARSRHLTMNAPIAAGALTTTVNSVVGWGLDPQPRIDGAFLGLTEQQTREWQTMAKRLWWAFAAGPSCDWSGRMNFAGMTALAFRSRLESGDIFAIRQWRDPRPGELFGTRVQLVEADRVCNPYSRPNTEELVEGIEFNADGEPIACYVLDRHPGDSFGVATGNWQRVPFVGSASGERRVLHLFKPTRPGSTRGVPLFAPVIETLQQIKTYSESELMAAVVSSFFTVFVKHPEMAEAEAGFKPISGMSTSTQSQAIADGQIRLGSGLVADLGPGEEVDIANPMRPNALFGPFVEQMLQQVGVAIGMPYELLVKRFTASYSASMASLQEAWRLFRADRGGQSDAFCQPVYEWVLSEAVARGYLHAPGFFENPLARQAWCTAFWTGPARGHLNPAQEATAAVTRMNSGVTTLEEETAAFSGRDWEENLEQQKMERRMRKEAGLDIEPVSERIRTEPTDPAPAPASPDRADREEEDDASRS